MTSQSTSLTKKKSFFLCRLRLKKKLEKEGMHKPTLSQMCALPSVPPSSYSSYTSANFPKKLYENVEERNKYFFDTLAIPPTQVNHINSYLEVKEPGTQSDISVAPRDYYNGVRAREPATLIGNLGVTPNLYDDVVRQGVPTLWVPDLNRARNPLTTTPMDPTVIPSLSWTPHEPCEVAPNHSGEYWVTDLNSRLYERTLINGAQEQPYSNFNRMQTLTNLLGMHMPNKSDYYTRPLDGKTYCETVKTEGQPASSIF
jgi:hypothetical protein